MKIVIALIILTGLLKGMAIVGEASRESNTNSSTITPFDSHTHKAGELWSKLASN